MSRAELVFTREADGFCTMEVHAQHRAAELLLRYSTQRAGALTDTALRSQTLDAERMLYEKQADPIAAAVGAYALLPMALRFVESTSPGWVSTQRQCQRSPTF
jgi:hypothetical protein